MQSNPYLTKENKEELIEEISKAALRLNARVENLLNISRLESGHIKPKSDWCDLVELVFDVVKRVEENNPKRKIAIHINPNLPLCQTDKGMLEQVIYNLLNNATIHTASHCQISIAASCHADLLQLIIEDNGQGFTTIAMKDAFDKLSRYKSPTTSGSGLGLSIVKGFTEALKGTVDLEKPIGGGARFTLCFPVKTSHFKMPVHE